MMSCHDVTSTNIFRLTSKHGVRQNVAIESSGPLPTASEIRRSPVGSRYEMMWSAVLSFPPPKWQRSQFLKITVRKQLHLHLHLHLQLHLQLHLHIHIHLHLQLHVKLHVNLHVHLQLQLHLRLRLPEHLHMHYNYVYSYQSI